MYSNTVPTAHRTSELDLGKRRLLRSKVFLRRFKRPKKKTDRARCDPRFRSHTSRGQWPWNSSRRDRRGLRAVPHGKGRRDRARARDRATDRQRARWPHRPRVSTGQDRFHGLVDSVSGRGSERHLTRSARNAPRTRGTRVSTRPQTSSKVDAPLDRPSPRRG